MSDTEFGLSREDVMVIAYTIDADESSVGIVHKPGAGGVGHSPEEKTAYLTNEEGAVSGILYIVSDSD